MRICKIQICWVNYFDAGRDYIVYALQQAVAGRHGLARGQIGAIRGVVLLLWAEILSSSKGRELRFLIKDSKAKRSVVRVSSESPKCRSRSGNQEKELYCHTINWQRGEEANYSQNR